MQYKFARFENDSVKKYEFDLYEDAKKWVDESLEKFKVINRVRDENKDKAYLRFKKELEEDLENMHKADKGQVIDTLKCDKCSDEDHEGIFCRCESRNIRIAKEKREKGECPWSKSQPERLNPK